MASNMDPARLSTWDRADLTSSLAGARRDLARLEALKIATLAYVIELRQELASREEKSEAKTYSSFDRNGEPVRMTVPTDD